MDMWLAEKRPMLASANLRMSHLRTRIKKRSTKYSFYKPSRRKDTGSERVDWVFVGFPSSSASNQQVHDNDHNITFEPLRRPVATGNLQPSSSSSFDIQPPPLPPRSKKKSSGNPVPPPRPASLYASLKAVPNPNDEYAQVIRSGAKQRKRPKSSELEQRPTAPAPPVPR